MKFSQDAVRAVVERPEAVLASESARAEIQKIAADDDEAVRFAQGVAEEAKVSVFDALAAVYELDRRARERDERPNPEADELDRRIAERALRDKVPYGEAASLVAEEESR